MDQLSPEIVDRINQALFEGRTLDAIKIYREAARTDLKDAKDFIDQLQARLWEQSPEKFSHPPGQGVQIGTLGCLTIAIVVIVGFVLLFRLF